MHTKFKKYFWIKVEYLSGKQLWLWCTPKLSNALEIEMRLQPNNYKSSILGNYLVVPYKKYLGNNERLTLAKVIQLERSNHRNFNWHQTRSQFLTNENIGTWLGFHYIKHNYNFITRTHLLMSSYIWKKRKNINDSK